MKKVTYNDGMGARSRRPALIIYTRNQVWIGPQNVEGVVRCEAVDSHKNGKWSSIDYEVYLSDGVDAVVVQQDFNTGKFFSDNCLSWSQVAKELGLNGVSPSAIEAAVRENWPNHARRLEERLEALSKLESSTPTNTVEFTNTFNTNRIGRDVLLVDGELFRGESIPGKVLVISATPNGQGGRYGATTYRLEVAEEVELEYLTEGGFEGDDCLRARGWTEKPKGWEPPSSATSSSGNIDLSALDGLKF